MALVEVHRELATVRNDAKHMVTKNKCLKKQEKYAHGQLAEAQRRISKLEEQLHAQPVANQQPVASVTQDELRNLETSLAKTHKAAETDEIEVGRFRDELRQSSDRETSIRVAGTEGAERSAGKITRGGDDT